MADSENIIQLGIEAARAGNKAQARDLFRLVTREDPENAQGWLWLAGVAEDREEKRAALERAVQIDPNNELARKGLQALGGATGRPATTPLTTSTPSTSSMPTTPAAVSTPPPVSRPTTPPPSSQPGALDDDLDFADSLNSMGFYEQAETGTSATARTYDSGGDDAWAPPDFGEDNFDLSDYQNRPRVSIEDVEAMEREEASRIVVENEGRRRGLPKWLPFAVGALAILLVLFLVMSLINRDDTVTLPPQPTAGNTAVAGNPNAGTGATAEPFDTAVLDPGGAAPTAIGAEQPTLPADGTQPTALPAGGAPTAAADVTTIVIEPGPTAPVPGDATPLPVDPNPTAPPVVEPTTPPAAGVDVSTANPAIVPNAQRIVAGNWNFVWDYGYGPLQTIGTGTYGGVTASRGQWLAITMAAGNTSGQPATIPDGLFVIKDAQNRVYDFNRAASIDWLNRLGRGVAADTSAGDPIGGESVSFVLLFDVPADATNLVLFSRDNPTQGYLVR